MFTFVECQNLPVKPYYQPAEVPLNSSPTLQNTDGSPCFGAIHKLGAVTFHPIVKDAKTVLVPRAPHYLSPPKLPTALLNLCTNHKPFLSIYPVLILPLWISGGYGRAGLRC